MDLTAKASHRTSASATWLIFESVRTVKACETTNKGRVCSASCSLGRANVPTYCKHIEQHLRMSLYHLPLCLPAAVLLTIVALLVPIFGVRKWLVCTYKRQKIDDLLSQGGHILRIEFRDRLFSQAQRVRPLASLGTRFCAAECVSAESSLNAHRPEGATGFL